MARTQIEQRLFASAGAGPKIRGDILPLATAATPGEVLFIMNYGLYLIGARTTAPDSTPPTYA